MDNPQYITLGPAAKNITGKRFGRLVALGPIGRNKRSLILWRCQCDCGNTKIVLGAKLQSGATRSCGCFASEVAAKNGKKSSYKHGMDGTPIYYVWSSMKRRCKNQNHPAYPNYGGRGIEVCERWESFANFYADMGDKPDGCSLDRIDNDGPYSPQNCRWATKEQQDNNRSTNIYITHNGETLTLTQWSKRSAVSMDTLYRRIKRGWNFERALTEPSNR